MSLKGVLARTISGSCRRAVHQQLRVCTTHHPGYQMQLSSCITWLICLHMHSFVLHLQMVLHVYTNFLQRSTVQHAVQGHTAVHVVNCS